MVMRSSEIGSRRDGSKRVASGVRLSVLGKREAAEAKVSPLSTQEEAHGAFKQRSILDRESRTAEQGDGRESPRVEAQHSQEHISDSRNNAPLTLKRVEHTQNRSHRSALLCELVIDRSVFVLDALSHAQGLVVTRAGSIQVALPSRASTYSSN